MKVKKTLKGNAKITLTMAELKDLKTLLNNSHDIGVKSKFAKQRTEEAVRVSIPLCQAIVNGTGVLGR